MDSTQQKEIVVLKIVDKTIWYLVIVPLAVPIAVLQLSIGIVLSAWDVASDFWRKVIP